MAGGLPTGDNSDYWTPWDFNIIGGGLDQLEDWTEDAVKAFYTNMTQNLPSIREVSDMVFDGIDSTLGIVKGILEFIMRKLLGFIPGLLEPDEIIDSFGNFGGNLRAFLADINFLDPDFSLEDAALHFFNAILSPLNVIAQIIDGFLPGDIIPDLDASKIITGVFSTGLIPALDAAIITTGQFIDALIPDIKLSMSNAMQDIVDGIYQAVHTGSSAIGNAVTTIKTSIENIPGINVISTLVAGVIPALDAAKITTGQFAQSFVTGLTTLASDFASTLTNLFGGSSPLSQIISGAVPSLDASKITSGAFAQSMVTGLTTLASNFSTTLTNLFGGSTPLSAIIAGAVPSLDASKITSGTFAQSMVTGLSSLASDFGTTMTNLFGGSSPLSQIITGAVPNLNASKITAGTFGTGLIPALDAAKITTGTFVQALIPSLTSGWGGSVLSSFLSGTIASGIIPALDAAKITTGTFAQSMVTGLTTIASNLSSTLTNLFGGSTPLSAIITAAVPSIDASKITTGTFLDALIPDITAGMSTDLQGMIDAGVNALNNTVGTVGQGFNDFEDGLAGLVTGIYNKLGGHGVSRTDTAAAQQAMNALASTVTQNSTALATIQGQLAGSSGTTVSVTFKDPDVQQFNASGSISYTLPSWFTLSSDYVDAIEIGGGGGGDGAGVGHSNGGNGGSSTFNVTDAGGAHTLTATGGSGSSSPNTNGGAAGSTTFNGLPYNGGGATTTSNGTGKSPGGGGSAALGVGAVGGLGASAWQASTYKPTSGTITGSVGTRGSAGTGPGGNGGAGGLGQINVIARQAMASLTGWTSIGSMFSSYGLGYRYNVKTALTDAQTCTAIWGADEGGILIIRGNTAFTSGVWLKVENLGGGVVQYKVGYLSGGSSTTWLTGTTTASVGFNAWSIIADSGYIFRVALNGSTIDTYNDSGHASSLGSTFRSGGFVTPTTVSYAPGTLKSWAFFDSGTPSTITQVDGTTTAIAVTSATYAALPTTPGPAVTVNVGADGRLVVDFSAVVSCTGAASAWMSIALSGANTLAASDVWGAPVSITVGATSAARVGNRKVFSGLNPGTTVVTAQYRRSSGTTVSFQYPTVIADPR